MLLPLQLLLPTSELFHHTLDARPLAVAECFSDQAETAVVAPQYFKV
ncbi:uncharacterized protein METZ01_LOCUS219232, partial [marine metagenome]